MALSFKVDGATVGLAVLTGGTAAAYLSGVNPSFFTMRAFSSSDPEKAARTRTDIRIGSAVGGALALATGAGASVVVNSWWPFLASLVVFGAIVATYEYALRNPHGYGGIEAQ